MKLKKISPFLLVGIAACSNGAENSNQIPKSSPTLSNNAVTVSPEPGSPENGNNFDTSLGLVKLSGRHDCSCTLNQTKFNLDGCDQRLALYCADTLTSPWTIAYQLTASGKRYWYATGFPSQQSISTSLPTCTDCLTQRIPAVFAGKTRYFHLYLPSVPASKLVMVLHGNGGSADQILGFATPKSASPLKAWLSIAKRSNLVLVIPDGTLGSEGESGWNDCRSDAVGNPSSNDVGFLSALTKALNQRYGVSKNFVTGMSNGGHMSIRLAAEAPEIFSGVAPISAAIAVNNQCTAKKKPISVLLMRGTDDPISPFSGGAMSGNRGKVLSMNDSLKTFLSWNGIVGVPTMRALPDLNTADNSTVLKISYPKSSVGTQVEGYVVSGGGHAEPSKTEFYGPLLKALVGEQNRDLESAEVVWDFFSRI